jgi:hypothetical protein
VTERPSVVSFNGVCASCSRTEVLYRNPVGPLPVCWECFREREHFASASTCICPAGVVRGECPTHGFRVPG